MKKNKRKQHHKGNRYKQQKKRCKKVESDVNIETRKVDNASVHEQSQDTGFTTDILPEEWDFSALPDAERTCAGGIAVNPAENAISGPQARSGSEKARSSTKKASTDPDLLKQDISLNALRHGFFSKKKKIDYSTTPEYHNIIESYRSDYKLAAGCFSVHLHRIAMYGAERAHLNLAKRDYAYNYAIKVLNKADIAQMASGGRAPLLEGHDVSEIMKVYDMDPEERLAYRFDAMQRETRYDIKLREIGEELDNVSMDAGIQMLKMDKSELYTYSRRISGCRKHLESVLKSSKENLRIARNSRIIAEFIEEIREYADQIETYPDTSHWKDLCRRERQIDVRMDALNRELRQAIKLSDSRENSFSGDKKTIKVLEKNISSLQAQMAELLDNLKKSAPKEPAAG